MFNSDGQKKVSRAVAMVSQGDSNRVDGKYTDNDGVPVKFSVYAVGEVVRIDLKHNGN